MIISAENYKTILMPEAIKYLKHRFLA